MTMAALLLSTPMTQVQAAGMTCADYDKPDVFSSCEFNANCCAGLASWKAACDIYHVHAESHGAASDMLKSRRAKHEWDKDYKACLRGHR
jgi:hypothetical protein